MQGGDLGGNVVNVQGPVCREGGTGREGAPLPEQAPRDFVLKARFTC